jgi:PAS domain S-box-containing protein
MEFEKKLKTKTIVAVITVLLILCSFYFYIGIQNQRQYRDWQIQKDNEIVSLEIKNLLYNTNSLYREKIKFFVNNQEIRKEFATSQADELYKKALPLYSILKSENPYHFIINFYGPDNISVLLLDLGPDATTETASPSSFVAKVNETSEPSSGFEYSNSQLYYKIVEPLFYDGKYLGCIEFGLRENEVAENLAKKFNIQIASVFDKKIVSPHFIENSTNQNTNQNLIIRSLYNSPVFSNISFQNQKLTTEKFKFNDKYYSSSLVEIQNQFRSEGFVGIVFIKDITQLENQYQVTIYRSLLIIILILIAVTLILHFSFNIILHKLFNLQESIDRRLEEKTKEIIKTNAELNQIFNTTGNSMRLIDNKFNVLRVNRTFSMMSGISKENAEGKKCYDVFPGPYCHTAECPLVRIKNGEERVEQDISKKNSTGTIIPGLITSVAFKGENGEVLGIIEDFKDISKRVEIEEALKRTEQQFSLFMDNIPVGVFIKDEFGKMLYINKYVKRSVLSDTSIGKFPKELFSEKYASRIAEEDKRAIAGEILVLEEELPDFSGNINSFLTHKFRFRNADNRWQIGGVMLDITNKKRTDLQLKILSNAIQHSPTCVVITNLKGEIEFVNLSFTQITGYSTSDVIGKEISLLRSEELSKSIFQDIMDIVITGVDWQGEFQNIKKNGEKYWELSSISPVKNEKGEITHFVFISEDITKRKHSEKELISGQRKG